MFESTMSSEMRKYAWSLSHVGGYMSEMHSGGGRGKKGWLHSMAQLRTVALKVF